MFHSQKRKDLDLTQLDETLFNRKVCMIGTVLAGKSTIAAGIVITCESMSAMIPNFYARVLPQSTRILVDANQMRRGHFPKKTDPYTANPYEAGLVISERSTGFFKKRKAVHVPLCDIAGEISDRIDPMNPGIDPVKRAAQAVNLGMIRRIRDSQGFIVALPANEAIMLREPSSKADADAYTYHILSQIIEYKRRTRSPKLEHIFVVLTKWDEVKDTAVGQEMDVYGRDQNGLYRFMVNGYPALSMLLKPLAEQGMVSFYRSYFEIRRGKDGAKKVHMDSAGRNMQSKNISGWLTIWGRWRDREGNNKRNH
jgi:hypothetical protein